MQHGYTARYSLTPFGNNVSDVDKQEPIEPIFNSTSTNVVNYYLEN